MSVPAYQITKLTKQEKLADDTRLVRLVSKLRSCVPEFTLFHVSRFGWIVKLKLNCSWLMILLFSNSCGRIFLLFII